MTITSKEIKALLQCRFDSIGKNKAGNFVLRRGYFYRNGMDSDKFAANIMTILGDRVTLIASGDCWKPFRGGATLANSSHFWVEIAPK